MPEATVACRTRCSPFFTIARALTQQRRNIWNFALNRQLTIYVSLRWLRARASRLRPCDS